MSEQKKPYRGRPAKRAIPRRPMGTFDQRKPMNLVILPNNLAALRTMRGYSQKKLANILGVTPAAVSLWECHVRTINDDTKLKICKALDCTVMELIDWRVPE